MSIVGTTILLFLPLSVHPHNWIVSPSRSSGHASSHRPIIPRTHTHVQTGPTQRVPVQFTTGHSGIHRLVVVSGRDYEQIKHLGRDFNRKVDEYIDNAPHNYAAQQPRFHTCIQSDCRNDTLYAENDSEDGVEYCGVETANARNYRPDALKHDQYVKYTSEKYPWIISGLRYRNLADLQYETDTVCLDLPVQRQNGKHYMIVWTWGGYSDVVDVYSLPFLVDENEMYGTPTGEYVFDRIHHCQFDGPLRPLTPIYDATVTPRECLEHLDRTAKAHNNTLKNLGVNVVPISNPPLGRTFSDSPESSANFPETVPPIPVNAPVNLSFPNTTIHFNQDYLDVSLNSRVMRIDGRYTQSTYAWNGWLGRTTVENNTSCIEGISHSGSFKSAVARCAGLSECWAFAFDTESAPLHHRDTNHGNFILCTDASNPETVMDPAWRLYRKEVGMVSGYTTPEKWNLTNHVNIRVSFQAMDGFFLGEFVEIKPKGFHIDHGQTYTQHPSGLSYGWKCNTELAYHLNPDGRIDMSAAEIVKGKISNRTWSTLCPDGSRNEWQIKLPNGIYVITIYGGPGGDGCIIQNTRFFKKGDSSGSFAMEVEVRDERVKLSSYAFPTVCQDIHWIAIDRLMDTYPNAWIPSAPEAWWQLDVSQNAKSESSNSSSSTRAIGIVSVLLPGAGRVGDDLRVGGLYASCEQRWFFSGVPSCPNSIRLVDSGKSNPDLWRSYAQGLLSDDKIESQQHMPWGELDLTLDHVGAVIAVSDEACTDSGGCQGVEQVCGVVASVPRCLSQTDGMCAIRLDCNGKRGRYVRIRLRGANRFLSLEKVSVYTSNPQLASVTAGKKRMICYGSEIGHKSNSDVKGEFSRSLDPRDPIFYSTCFRRREVRRFYPVVNDTIPDTTTDWRLYDKCLSCSLRHEDKQHDTPQWVLSPSCVNCFGNRPWAKSNNITTHSTTNPTMYPSRSPTSVPTSANKLFYIDLTIRMSISDVSVQFKKKLKSDLAEHFDFSVLDLSVNVFSGSVIARVTFHGSHGERDAKAVSSTGAQELSHILKVDIEAVSTVRQVGVDDSSKGEENGHRDKSKDLYLSIGVSVSFFCSVIIVTVAWCIFSRRRQRVLEARNATCSKTQDLRLLKATYREAARTRRASDSSSGTTVVSDTKPRLPTRKLVSRVRPELFTAISVIKPDDTRRRSNRSQTRDSLGSSTPTRRYISTKP
ncbi:hypothetical protein AAMO2058_000042500 [Amorphochlora amoebiformis]